MVPMNGSPAAEPAVVTARIRVTQHAAEATEEFLWTLDPGAVSHAVYGDEVELGITVPAAVVGGLTARIAAFLGDAGMNSRATVEATPYHEQDWANAYRQEFEPIFVGDRLTVAPTWWEAALPDDRTTLRIDPQMAFGTGHHPTTRACLEWLVRRATAPGARPGGLIDAGCGSGLLAIAAHHLGFTPVVAIDNDPVACATTRHNAAANDAAQIAVIDGDIANAELPCVPTVVANLTAGTIVEVFPILAAHATADGQIYLAGILPAQETTVAGAISDYGWRITERHPIDGWLGLAVCPDT
jgi:ribosomal protein L11 methyltransferase